MINKLRIIQFWGFCDLLFIVWWVSKTIARGDIPIYDDIKNALNTSFEFGLPMPIILSIVALFLSISFIYSGKLLIQLNPKGAIVSYFQLPCRIITLTPSLFFAQWPIKYLFNDHKQILIAGITIIILSETAKLASIIPWHMKLEKNLITSG